MREIQLTQGQVAIVDDIDFEELNQFKWCAVKVKRGKFYASRRIGKTHIKMHRSILNAPKDLDCDHINGCTLDNRRKNLRLATHQQNLRNRDVQKNNKLEIKGVCWNKQAKKFETQIKAKCGKIFLGYFFCLEKAKAAHREAELKYFGEFARQELKPSFNIGDN